MKSIILLAAMTVMLASCGPEPTTTKTQVQEPTYHNGQYVYIHGEVKGIVKDNHNDGGCGGGPKAQYKVVVAGTDGTAHTWYVNDDELSPTRDTIVSMVITERDSSNVIVYKAILDNQEISNSILETDRQIKRQLEQRAKTNNGI